MPLIPSTVLVLSPRPLKGQIAPGEVFAWEPNLPYSRQLLIVTRIELREGDEALIWATDMDYTEEFWNYESRFREACIRTMFNKFPTTKKPLGEKSPPEFAPLLATMRKGRA